MKMITINRVCPMCGRYQTFDVPHEGYMAWLDGELIQRAMPNVPAEDREIILSGFCPDCQKVLFDE